MITGLRLEKRIAALTVVLCFEEKHDSRGMDRVQIWRILVSLFGGCQFHWENSRFDKSLQWKQTHRRAPEI